MCLNIERQRYYSIDIINVKYQLYFHVCAHTKKHTSACIYTSVNNGGDMPGHNSQRRLARVARPHRNTRQAEMKTRLLQKIYANHFA